MSRIPESLAHDEQGPTRNPRPEPRLMTNAIDIPRISPSTFHCPFSCLWFCNLISTLIMSGVKSRLASLVGHLTGSTSAPFEHRFNNHTLSPTFFLPRAAAIEPDVRGHWSFLAGATAALCLDQWPAADIYIGGSSLPRYSQQPGSPPELQRACGSGPWSGLLFEKAWVQESGHSVSKYTGILGIDLRNRRCRGY